MGYHGTGPGNVMTESNLRKISKIYQQSDSNFTAQKPLIKLDSTCMSCSGHSNMIIQAFKLACLDYEQK